MKTKAVGFMKNCRSILKSVKGVSYLEFSMTFFAYIILILIALQAYSMLNAQVLVMNTTRSALRQAELNGGPPETLLDDVKESLSRSSSLDASSVKVYMNDPEDETQMVDLESVSELQYQLRKKIELKMVVKYRVSAFGKSLQAISYTIPLSSKYTGTSEKFFKEGGDYTEVTE